MHYRHNLIRDNYIQGSEIQEYIDEIYCKFYIFTSENIKFYIFTPPEGKYNFYWITSDISIDLLQCSSELQTPITFLFVNENIKCGYAFSELEHKEILVPNYLALLKFFVFHLLHHPLQCNDGIACFYVTSSRSYDVSCQFMTSNYLKKSYCNKLGAFSLVSLWHILMFAARGLS